MQGIEIMTLKKFAEETKKENARYELFSKFLLEKSPLKIMEGNHEECMAAAKSLLSFLRMEHKVHGTGITFNESFSPFNSDVILVHAELAVGSRRKIKLWVTFEIRKVVLRQDTTTPPTTDTLIAKDFDRYKYKEFNL